MSDRRRELAEIRTFPQLVKYLRDELEWPIASDDFEDLYFDYTPEELGIDSKNAAKIQEIKRLRPLSVNQPWGVLFVKFEPKRLPVVALRRILRSVVLKKRASANRSERATWDAEDLLFISGYGEGDARQISFAHFSQATDEGLPTLNVLGWDNLDTVLHIDDVAQTLDEHLVWPEDEADVERWREDWRSAFTLRHREVITTSRDLSIRLADLARAIRNRIRAGLAIETKEGPLTRLLRAFKEALVHDLDADGFADMYAQTIAYGLLSARIATPGAHMADDLPVQIPVTTPFLKELMETFLQVGGRRGKGEGAGIDFDELGVSEVVDLLDEANMEAVVRDFGDRNPLEDPVIHFYELFLKEYDPREKLKRGVFYTPRPVVAYIVRSVDELLRTEFGLEDGLADITTWSEMATRHELMIPDGVDPDEAFVQILDPATGTGTFLVEVIGLIHRRMSEKWKVQGLSAEEVGAMWNEYVPAHLLPRLHGYEILMAPYAMAHLKIGLKLYETGYRFGSNERTRIYLTNSLEPAQEFSGQFEFAIPALAHEAQTVNEIKRRLRFTVIIGNPPYSGASSNRGDWIRGLVRHYHAVDGQPLGERNPRWLQDDYVKFIRLSEHLISATTTGVVGMITNHAFLDNPTFRGLRRSLQTSFTGSIHILDLHGNTKKRERDLVGRPDKNVFDIQQGVAISLLSKSPSALGVVHHGDCFGTREEKYGFLSDSSLLATTWQGLDPRPPAYVLVPQGLVGVGEYERWSSLLDVMPFHSNGIVTARDHLCVRWSREEMWSTVRQFASMDEEDARRSFNLGPDSRDWKVALAQEDLLKDGPRREAVTQLLYRPFDVRWTYYTGRSRGFLCMPRGETMRPMLGGNNIALVTSRMTKGEDFAHVQVSRYVTEAIVMSPRTSNNGFIFPLYLGNSEFIAHPALIADAAANLSPEFLRFLKALNGTTDSVRAEEVFRYIYAILHSPSYRDRYSDLLRGDFPRIPVPASAEMLVSLARLGGELVALHLMESPRLDDFITTYEGPKTPEVGRIGWSDDTVWLDAHTTKEGQALARGTSGFRGVPVFVWNFHIGGYRVCEKWLKSRKGRILSNDDITHYQRIVVAIAQTIRLMKEIDEVIEERGGWPGAFAVEGVERESGRKSSAKPHLHLVTDRSPVGDSD